MARNRNAFAQELTQIITNASSKAFKQSFFTQLNDDDSIESIAQKMSSTFSATFAQELAVPLATAIDDHLDSQEFDVSGLTAGGSTVTGILESISS